MKKIFYNNLFIILLSFQLTNAQNKTIIIPNGTVSNGAITNFSTQATRRVDIVFGIGYDDDMKKAKDILTGLIEADDRILKDPEPLVVVSNLLLRVLSRGRYGV